MKPYYQDDYVTIYHGDCREILPELPKVDLVLTDPPYGISQDSQGLRNLDYGAWGELHGAYFGEHCKPAYFIDSPDAERWHPTQKPLLVVQHQVQASCPPGGSVLDPFLGSGTTAVAAKKLNRKCIGIEIEERYCEIAANRCRQSVFELGI